MQLMFKKFQGELTKNITSILKDSEENARQKIHKLKLIISRHRMVSLVLLLW